MQPSRNDALDLVQQVVLGERNADAPEVQAALAAFPDLAEELRELGAIGRHLQATTADAADVEREARAAMTEHDVQRVRRVVTGEAPRRRRWPLLLAALLLVSAAVAFWQIDRAPVVDGMLGQQAGVVVDRSGATWSIDPGVPLPPGAEYRVTLEIDGREAFSDPFRCPIQLPTAWQQLVDRATAATLLVELPELGVRRRVALR